jgi:hypothetical protein
MTNEDHNKTLGIMHLAYGALHGLMMLLIGILFAVFIPVVGGGVGTNNGMPIIIYVMFLAMLTLFGLFYSVPSLVAGYALLKRKSWARLAAIIASVTAAMNVPLGTALCIYTLWFFFGEGARMHDKAALSSQPRRYLGEEASQPADFFDRRTRKQGAREPVAERRMPNWRD